MQDSIALIVHKGHIGMCLLNQCSDHGVVTMKGSKVQGTEALDVLDFHPLFQISGATLLGLFKEQSEARLTIFEGS